MKRMFWMLMVVGLAHGCGSDDSGGSAQDAAPTAETAAPAAEAASTQVADAPAGPHPGEQTYNRSCFSCHAAGVAGAPKTGDAEAWGPRIAKGPELMLQSVKDGMPPGMPPMGLCMSCSDEELADAIDYMLPR